MGLFMYQIMPSTVVVGTAVTAWLNSCQFLFFFIYAKARMIPHASPSEAAVSFNKK